jgi:pyruvate,water dikinase
MIMRLGEIGPAHSAEVGGKAANLARLIQNGFPIPESFCIASQHYGEHIQSSSIAHLIQEVLQHASERKELCSRLTHLRNAIVAAPLQANLSLQIEEVYQQLGGGQVAVRSSATSEDLAGHSFAGQHDTFLGVRGIDSVIHAVKSCWASLWTDRAFEYRQRRGFNHEGTGMGVIVQVLVPAKASGVMFTSDPLGANADQLIIEGCFGLGEALVSGRVNPDRFVFTKSDRRVLEWTVSEKKIRTVVGPETGVCEEALAEELQKKPCVSEATLRRLAEVGVKAESDLGGPQDIEWAVAEGEKIFVLQSRPITTLAPKKSIEDRQVWSNLNAGEVMPDVATPMTWSIVERLIYQMFGTILGRLGMGFGRHALIGQIAGRAYFNLNTFTGLMRMLPGIGSMNPTEMFGGSQDTQLAEQGGAIAPEDIPHLNFDWVRFLLNLPGFGLWFMSHSTHRGLQFAAALRKDTEQLERISLSSLSDQALVRRLCMLVTDPRTNVHAISYAGVGLMYFSSVFALCRRWLGDIDGSLATRLLAGLGHMDSAESALDMWRLAEFAHEHQEVERVLLESVDFAGAQAVLPSVAGGSPFLGRWWQFMQRHGHHTRAEIEFMNPRWRETPDFVLDLIRGYLRSMGAVNPLESHRRRGGERRELNATIRAKIRNPIKRQVFQFLLEGAQRGCLVRENVKSEIVRRVAYARSVLLELGNRWRACGHFDKSDDIFFVRVDEIEAAKGDRDAIDFGQTVAERRAEYERNQTIVPPAVIVGRFDPEHFTPDRVDRNARVLRGLAVSAGTAVGKAHVILRSDTTEQIQPGEILVAPFTDPGWTPYFLRAAGIVVDMGGLLSHGSIVAREYGIPAVANVGPATGIIRTGQRIEVDGNKGEVRILGDA